jgi:hypothetical protein
MSILIDRTTKVITQGNRRSKTGRLPTRPAATTRTGARARRRESTLKKVGEDFGHPHLRERRRSEEATGPPSQSSTYAALAAAA